MAFRSTLRTARTCCSNSWRSFNSSSVNQKAFSSKVKAATALSLVAGGVTYLTSNSVAHADTAPSLSERLKSSRLFVWGSGQYGQTGIGDDRDIGLPTLNQHLIEEEIVAISAGGQQTMALTKNGVLWTFGRGEHFRLGFNTDENEKLPREVEQLRNEKVVSIDCGDQHMAAVTENGEVWTWGRNLYSQLGHKSARIPQKMDGLDGIKAVHVSCGQQVTIIIDDQGRVYSVGNGKNGALGSGDTKSRKQPKQIEFFADKKVKQVAAGFDYSLFLTEDGDVYASGRSDYGQLGIGKIMQKKITTPALCRLPRGEKIKCIAAGMYHNIAVSEDGQLYTWGFNKNGQCGVGDNYHKNVPTHIRSLQHEKIKLGACGGHHTAVLSEGNNLYLFGAGRSGQIGRQDNIESQAAERKTPVLITYFQESGQSPIQQVALGQDHSSVLCY